MSNTPALTEFFVSDKYLQEINVDNPLGMQGQIAKTYGDLIKSMWSGNHPCLAPREFKMAVGRFAPQFSGFQQQDCQELMAFLLDGLHEDLNRITVKPYIEINSGIETRPDAVVAAESWANYKKRNDSVIIDTFHGLLKSTLVCPDCELVSVTFDPFCYLSLPLPVKREKAVTVTFFPAASSLDVKSESSAAESNQVTNQPVKIEKLMVPKAGTALDICISVAKVINENKNLNNGYTVDPSRLVVTEVYNHRFHKMFSNADTFSNLPEELHVFETVEDKVPIPVYLREIKGKDNRSLFGQPMIVNIEEPVTYDAVYDAVLSQVQKYLKDASDDEAEEENVESDTDEGVGVESPDELFAISIVNSYGTISPDKMDRSKPINPGSKIFLAADFKPSIARRYDSDREYSLCQKLSLIKSTAGKTSLNLDDCIKQFTTTEKLGSDDPWFCPRCKKHQEATKKFDLWNLPKVLIIHLKRFSYSRFWRDKLDTIVDFPVQGLNMSPFVINHTNKDTEKLYDLCAVANHYGGLGGGHYTAYGKNKDQGTWHYFDDSNVTQVPEENVVSKAGYVLFYVRRED
jgi:ubiquitin carboxyl-terminal hydrolase 4/11/15